MKWIVLSYIMILNGIKLIGRDKSINEDMAAIYRPNGTEF